ncbi:MAG: outer membrane protein transport protein [Deltaproteobacteria bacterium]|nr:outer membrane protein transport protein [Deltaproteobacteria bacterium]
MLGKKLGVRIAFFSITIPIQLYAGTWEMVGFGSRGSAMAGAMAGLADDSGAIYYNAAGLTAGPDAKVAVGYVFSPFNLKFNGEEVDAENISGLNIGAVGAIPMGPPLEDKLFVGLGVFVPTQHFFNATFYPQTEPHFVRFQNAGQKFSFDFALAYKPVPFFSLAAGANFFINYLATTTIETSPLQGAVDRRVVNDTPAEVAPIAGVLFNPGESFPKWRRWRVGASYRDASEMETAIPFQADFAGALLDVDIRGITFFEPARAALGVSYRLLDRLTIATQADYVFWSDFPSDALSLTFEGIEVVVPQTPEFDDKIVGRIGLEYPLLQSGDVHFTLRGGYAFDPSPVPPQTGETNLLDGDRQIFASGFGFKFLEAIGENPLSMDLFFQYHLLDSVTTSKDSTVSVANPGAAGIESEGNFYSFGISFVIRI